MPKDYTRRDHDGENDDKEYNPEHGEWIPGYFEGRRQHGYSCIEPKDFYEFQSDEEAHQSNDVNQSIVPQQSFVKVDENVRNLIRKSVK